jgi:type I restriction enzyme M protein
MFALSPRGVSTRRAPPTRSRRALSLMAIDPTQPLTLSALEAHLWETANILRSHADTETQRDYVLALLFFRRASDLHAEETAAALEKFPPEVVQAQSARLHSLQLPDGYHWQQICGGIGPDGQPAGGVDTNQLGQAINDALRQIAAANPDQLSRVFDYTDFNNRQRLPAETLREMVTHFNKLGRLTRDRLPSDMLGQAYEWLIAKFAAESGKAGGEFYTPEGVGKLGARLLRPGFEGDIYDPTCGSCGLLMQLRDEAFRLHGDKARRINVFGQEMKATTWALGRMNMLLHGAGAAAKIEQGDTLKNPAFRSDDTTVRQFDLIIANPPFSSSNWGADWLRQGDPFGRISHVPPKKHGEMAFVQHMVASLKPTGRMAVVLPNGALFRARSEQAFRAELIDGDLVEAVVQLPKDMFYGAGIPACYLIVNRDKPQARKGRVLFIDASECFERQDTKNVLRPADIDKIEAAFVSDEDTDGFSAWVTNEDIAKRRYNLTVRRYVRGAEDDEVQLTVEEALAELAKARAEQAKADKELDELLKQLIGAGAATEQPAEAEVNGAR